MTISSTMAAVNWVWRRFRRRLEKCSPAGDAEGGGSKTTGGGGDVTTRSGVAWSTGMTTDGVAAVEDDGGACFSAASASAGIKNLAPQVGQMPRLPARKALTCSLCPFGQERRIPMFRPLRSRGKAAEPSRCGGQVEQILRDRSTPNTALVFGPASL